MTPVDQPGGGEMTDCAASGAAGAAGACSCGCCCRCCRARAGASTGCEKEGGCDI